MIVAIAEENGCVFPHFGETPSFRLYTIQEGKVVSTQSESTNGASHRELIPWLKSHHVEVLICGGIGGGAVEFLQDEKITLYAGEEGAVDDLIQAYLHHALKNGYVPSECCGGHEGKSCGCGDKH